MKPVTKLQSLLDGQDWLAMTIGVAVATVLSLSNITRWSIWFDEAFSAHMIQHSFVDIARYTVQDVHPPLYYWVLKVWSMAFGRSELALRSLSLFFLLIALVVTYVLVRAVFSRRAAVLTMILLVLSPMLFRYGIEVRMYTMEVCIVLAATAALVYALRFQSRVAWVTYGVFIGLGMLTHYLSAMVWAAQGLWLIALNWRPRLTHTIKQTFGVGYGIALLVAFGLIIWWVPFVVWQFLHIQNGGFWIPPVTFNTVPNLITNMYIYQDSAVTQGWMVIVILVTVIISAYLVRLTWQSLAGLQRQVYGLILVTALVSPMLLFAASMPPFRPSFVDRYVLASITFWLIAVGIAVAARWRKPVKENYVRLFYVVTVILLLAGCAQVYIVGNLNKDNGSVHTMRQGMQLVNSKAQDSEPIITDFAWRYYEASFYQQAPHTVYFLSEDGTKDGSYAMLQDDRIHKIVDLNQFGKQHPIAWFITYGLRDVPPHVPAGWMALKTYYVPKPSELKIVRMQYIGT